MDAVAALAGWDLLSVMDETDLERVNHSRIQIPYLFMLEYAQWRQLSALGLKPDLALGHSLGELAALCVSGALPLDAAWHLVETRAAHMALMEERAGNESGMLAVSAGWSEVQEALKENPELYVSNRNTERQFVLSGPREKLYELRKNLRRRRIPAFMLGMSLAFHNPAMRVLRDLSVRRLNGLEMRPPRFPLLSCVTAGPYPKSQPDICGLIADLDENTVDWPKTISAARDKYGAACFVELGPQETLCGLTSEVYPDAACFSASRKGHEKEAMRRLCARLYSLGLLRDKSIVRLAERKSALPDSSPRPSDPPPLKTRPPSPEWTAAMELLAEETGRPVSELGPELDLRYDLALRSSRFPYLVQEAERRFKRQIALENLTQISTAGDLAAFLSGGSARFPKTSPERKPPFERPSPLTLPPLGAFKFDPSDQSLKPWPLDPSRPASPAPLQGTIALCALDEDIMPEIWAGMAPFRMRLLIPSFLLRRCALLQKSGGKLLRLRLERGAPPEAIVKAMEEARAKYGPFSGVLFIPPPRIGGSAPDFKKYLDILPRVKAASPESWLCCLRRQCAPPSENGAASPLSPEALEYFSLLSALPAEARPSRAIWWLDQRSRPDLQNLNEAGDMLARNLLFAAPERIVWTSAEPKPAQSPAYCPAAECLEEIQALDSPPPDPAPGAFLGEAQFSLFKYPGLSAGGNQGAIDGPPLPLGLMLKTLLGASRLACPQLEPFAISDVQIESFPRLPYGITRECRVEARAGQRLMQEKTLARLCRASMSARTISANGRRGQAWEPVCGALLSLGRPAGAMTAHDGLELPRGGFSALSAGALDAFYSAAGLGEEWRLIEEFEIFSGAAKNPPLFYQARAAKARPLIAGSSEWAYNDLAVLIEALCQALGLALARAGEGGLSGGRPRLRRIGFMRFDTARIKGAERFFLRFARSWDDARFTRFDGVIENGSGQAILSFLHFEFDKAE